MSCSADIHVADVGTLFIATVYNQDDEVEDVSSATSLTMTFKKPDGTTLDVDAELYSDGTDGKIQYGAVSGDLDQAGMWQVQGVVTISGSVFHTSIHKFRVLENL